MRNLKQTELQRLKVERKENLRIKRENENIENHEKKCLVTLKRLKRGDDNELKRNLANSLGWPWRQNKKEEQERRMMQPFCAYHSNLMF